MLLSINIYAFDKEEFLLEVSEDTYNYLTYISSINNNDVPENWYKFPETGNYFSPEEAIKFGLIDKVVKNRK